MSLFTLLPSLPFYSHLTSLATHPDSPSLPCPFFNPSPAPFSIPPTHPHIPSHILTFTPPTQPLALPRLCYTIVFVAVDVWLLLFSLLVVVDDEGDAVFFFFFVFCVCVCACVFHACFDCFSAVVCVCGLVEFELESLPLGFPHPHHHQTTSCILFGVVVDRWCLIYVAHDPRQFREIICQKSTHDSQKSNCVVACVGLLPPHSTLPCFPVTCPSFSCPVKPQQVSEGVKE